MAHAQRPGNDREDITRAHTPESLKKSHEKSEKLSPETIRDLDKVRGFIAKRDLSGLKSYLRERGGEIATISSSLRAGAEKNVGPLSGFKRSWSSDEIQSHIEKYVRNDSFLEALRFIDANEQYLIESWVQDYLDQKLYHQARYLLQDYAKTKPPKRMTVRELEIEEEIDALILSGVETEMGQKIFSGLEPEDEGAVHNFQSVKRNFRHDRIWSAVHNGCYEQAAEMCDRLYEEVYGKRKPAVVESQTQVEQRHERELLEAMPDSIDDLQKAFSSLPELISHFHHFSEKFGNDEASMMILKGRFELLTEKLFNERKVVIQDSGVVKAQEQFLGLVDDLGYLGLHLYINPAARDHQLYLLYDGETDTDPLYDGFRQVDLRQLSADDIILDKSNFIEEASPYSEPGAQGKTAVMAPNSYTWTSKIVSITPDKAWQLRHAA